MKRTELHIADNLTLPVDFITERIAFLARTGAGKSGGMRVLFEEYLEARQFVVFVDPKGDAWGVRAAGRHHAGYPVLIMGGDHADIPLDPFAGKTAAEFLVRERVSTVLDVSEFDKKEMNRFVNDLARTLYQLNRDVLGFILDEADMVAGEQFYDPNTLHAIQLLQNKGRGRGFGFNLATQRSAIINKSVLNACGTLIAMQTVSAKDVKVVRDYLEIVADKKTVDEIVSQLPTMKTREALVYSPQYLGIEPRRITFREFRTFDSMRTPKPGESRQKPKSLADIDLVTVERDMAATIEQVKANDPTELKARLAEANQRIEDLEEAAAAAAPECNHGPIIEQLNGDVAFLREAIGEYDKEVEGARAFIDRITTAHGEMYTSLASLLSTVDKTLSDDSERLSSMSYEFTDHTAIQRRVAKMGGPIPVFGSQTTDRKLVEYAPPVTRTEIAPRQIESNGKRAPASQRILDAIAELNALGVEKPPRVQVAFFAGYTNLNSKPFAEAMSELRATSKIDCSTPGTIALTAAGKAAASRIDKPRNPRDVQNRVVTLIGGASERILRPLIAAYPRSVTRIEVAKAAGYSNLNSKPFAEALSHLRRLGFIESPKTGEIAAAPVLFLQ